MSYIYQHGDYVKFVRTTSAVWENVPASEKNGDTLYFVLNAAKTSGDLYLGATLISGGVSSSFSLSDLNDVLAYNSINLTDGDILTWDATDNQWKPTSLFDVLTNITSAIDTMTGATASTDGKAGLVPVPQRGQQDWVLHGDGTWKNPVPEIQQVINTNAANWFGSDWDNTNGTIIGNKTVRSIATEQAAAAVAEIVAQAPEELDTLQEIAEWIANDETNTVNFVQKITYLENRMINGIPANEESGEPAVPSIVSQINTLNTNYTNLGTRVTNVEEALKWRDMSEEESE